MTVSSPFSALHARSVGLNKKFKLPKAPNTQPPATPADPYAAIIGGLPKPLTSAQIASQAKGQISPLVAAVTGQINREAQAATNAISGFTGDAAAKLGAVDFQQPYNEAEQKQAAVDAALRQSLAGAGAADADQLAQRLAVLNDRSVAAAASAVRANGAASGNTQLAQGSADLGALLANAAAAGSYGQKLPGIARLAGLQQLSGVQQGAQKNIADQSSQLESQLPAIIQGLQSLSDSRAGSIASARQNQLARQDAFATTDANNATRLAQTQVTAAAGVTKAKISAAEKATSAEISRAKSDRTYRLQFAKTFGYDPVSNKVTPGFKRTGNGTIVKVSTSRGAGSGVKPPTANELNGYVDAFKNGKPVSLSKQLPNTDANGNPVYKSVRVNSGALSFTQAYKRLRALGVADQQARAALDSAYKRGEQGRGWLTNEEQSALAKAKAVPRAHRYKSIAYLDRTQAEALTAAGAMPPGQWTQGRTKVKDLGPIFVIDESFD